MLETWSSGEPVIEKQTELAGAKPGERLKSLITLFGTRQARGHGNELAWAVGADGRGCGSGGCERRHGAPAQRCETTRNRGVPRTRPTRGPSCSIPSSLGRACCLPDATPQSSAACSISARGSWLKSDHDVSGQPWATRHSPPHCTAQVVYWAAPRARSQGEQGFGRVGSQRFAGIGLFDHLSHEAVELRSTSSGKRSGSVFEQ